MPIKPIAALVFAACIAGPALAQSGPDSSRPTILIHGNYCGPGNNAPLPPVDALDAACARHDACTPDNALPSKACNLRLQRDAEQISLDPLQPDDLRAMAGLVSVGAAMMLSEREPTTPPVATSSGLDRNATAQWSGMVQGGAARK